MPTSTLSSNLSGKSQPHALRTSVGSPRTARKTQKSSASSPKTAPKSSSAPHPPPPPRQQNLKAKDENEQFLWRDCQTDVQQAVGPYSRPTGVGVITARVEHYKRDPTIIAATFLQCMLVRMKTRALAQKMIATTLHSSCKTGGGGVALNAESIRTFTVKKIQVLAQDPNTIKSLVKGSCPDNGYNPSPPLASSQDESAEADVVVDDDDDDDDHMKIQFDVEKVTTGNSPSSSSAGIHFANNRDPNASPTCDVHFVCTGALPTHSRSRFIRLELEKDGRGWRVKDFADLVKPVLTPTMPKEEEPDVAVAEAEPYFVPSAWSATSGLNKPLFGGGVTRWKNKAKRETEAQRMLRQEQAKTNTKGLARKLSAAELNRKFAANPVDRVIISTSSGMITKRMIKKGELFDKTVGFEVKMRTVEDHQKEQADAQAAAETVAKDRRAARIQAALGMAASG